MFKKTKWLILLFSLVFVFNSQAIAFSGELVVINEIAWMGTEVAWQRQWIELYNPGEATVSLDGWKIDSVITNNIQIELSGTIEPKSYFLLERTSDETVPNVKADQIYTGNLNNAGEKLLLINSKGEVVDKVDCSLGWFAGDNATKQTMERIDPYKDGSDPFNWKTSNEVHGTPRAKNSPVIERKTTPIDTVYLEEPNSRFYFLLTMGIFVSICIAFLVLALVLKIKRNRGSDSEANDTHIDKP